MYLFTLRNLNGHEAGQKQSHLVQITRSLPATVILLGILITLRDRFGLHA